MPSFHWIPKTVQMFLSLMIPCLNVTVPKKVELLAKVYDHAKHKYRFGFRMLTLGWSDGSTFLPVNSILLSTENKKNRINEAAKVDKRTIGYKRRKLSMEKGTSAMLTLLETAKKAAIPAKYVLFDSWFSSPSTLHAVKGIGYDVIGMVKKTPKMFFRYNGEDMSLVSIYNRNKKRRGRSRYLLSVMVDVVKDGEIIPAKVVYVRNRNKRKEYLCLISTDVNLDENEIIRIYGKRWDIEVFFNVFKSHLNLSKECNSLSYDAKHVKFLLHSLIAVYLACFLTTQEKYFYPRPTCIFRI